MNGLQPFFYNLIYHTQLFIGIFAVALGFYYLIFRRYVFSAFDPMTFDLFYSCVGFSEVIFMYLVGEIKNIYLLSFLATQFAFFAGILAFGRIKNISKPQATARNESTKSSLERPLTKLIFMASVVLLFQSYAVDYIQNGFPMFRAVSSVDERSDVGMSIFKRISYVSSPICILLSMLYCAIGARKMRWIGGIILFIITLDTASTGAKQGIISMVFYLSFIILYLHANGYKEYRFLSKSRNILFVASILVTLLIIRLKYSDQIAQSLYFLQFRILLSGDSFIMGYPQGVIGNLPDYNWVYGLFGGPLRQLHIVPPSDLPPAIGYELYWYHNPNSSLLIGPNSRHNIVGARHLSFFGAIIYSAILGVIYGKIRSGLNNSHKLSPLLFVAFCLYCTRISQMEADPLLYQSYAINVTLIFTAIYTMCYILKESGCTGKTFTAEATGTKC